MEFIQLIFLSNRKAEQILEILEKKYDILLEKEEEKEVRKMCTFSEALIEKGELRGEGKGMLAYKGFEKGLICRGYQFTMGKNVTDQANCQRNGFHCAANPLDCLYHYPNIYTSEYYLVKAEGDLDEDAYDSKISCTELTILRKLDVEQLILHGLAYESGAAGYYFGEKSDHMSTPRIESASRRAELAERGKQAISRLVDSLDMENIVSQLRDLKEFEDTGAQTNPWVPSAFSRRH